jgi:hypothetical protein
MDRRTFLLASFTLLALGTLGMAGRAQTPPAQPTAAGDKRTFTPQELDQMLAPIALYPDALLSQVLMAASYPLEIVEAARWSNANPALKGDAAVAAVKDQSWDASVISLVAFPSVLMQLNDHLDWTQKLGDAMISQQADVADSIQRLRAKAADAGNLKTTPQQTVTSQGTGSDRTIVIAPANPEVIYVPAYNPSWAYGPWPYAAYPPIYYPPPPNYGYGAVLATGLVFGLGIAASSAMYSNWNWGHSNSYVNVNVNRAVNIDNNFDRNAYANNNKWQHDAGHRRGVAYRDPATRQQFGQDRPGVDQRQQFRGQLANTTPANRTPADRTPVNRPAVGTPGTNLQQRQPAAQNRANLAAGDRPTALSGTNRGQQVNREAARGRAQQTRAQSHPNYTRGGGGGGVAAGGGGRGGRR